MSTLALKDLGRCDEATETNGVPEQHSAFFSGDAWSQPAQEGRANPSTESRRILMPMPLRLCLKVIQARRNMWREQHA